MINISTTESCLNTPNNISLQDYTNILFRNNPVLGYKTIKGIITPYSDIIYSGNVSARMYNHLLETINKSKFTNINLIMLCTDTQSNTNTKTNTKTSFIIPSSFSVKHNTSTRIDINTNLIGELYEIGSNIIQDNDAFVLEQSFLNQLPFLEYLQNNIESDKNIKIVPIIVTSYHISSLMEKKLTEIINKPSSFVIISTNFNCVGPKFGTRLPSAIELRKMDMLAIDFIINKQYEYLEKGLYVCGDKVLILLDRLKNIKRNNLQLVIRKTNNHCKNSVVSYLGILFVE